MGVRKRVGTMEYIIANIIYHNDIYIFCVVHENINYFIFNFISMLYVYHVCIMYKYIYKNNASCVMYVVTKFGL